MAQIANVEYFKNYCNFKLRTNYTWNSKQAINVYWVVTQARRIYNDIHRPIANGCRAPLTTRFNLSENLGLIAADTVFVRTVIDYLAYFNKVCDIDCPCTCRTNTTLTTTCRITGSNCKTTCDTARACVCYCVCDCECTANCPPYTCHANCARSNCSNACNCNCTCRTCECDCDCACSSKCGYCNVCGQCSACDCGGGGNCGHC